MDVCYQISSRLNIKFCHQSAILDFLFGAISREIFELSIWIFFTDWYQIWNMYCWISRQSKIQYGRKGIILDFLSATITWNFYHKLIPIRVWALSNFHPITNSIRLRDRHLGYPFDNRGPFPSLMGVAILLFELGHLKLSRMLGDLPPNFSIFLP